MLIRARKKTLIGHHEYAQLVIKNLYLKGQTKLTATVIAGEFMVLLIGRMLLNYALNVVKVLMEVERCTVLLNV